MSVAAERTRAAPASPLARVRRAVRAVPPAGWLCALVAVLLAAAWSIVLPPFQLPDEIGHYAYVEHLAQAHRPPAERPDAEPFLLDVSPALLAAYRDTKAEQVGGDARDKGVWSALDQRTLARDEQAPLSRSAGDYSYASTPQPPLYYALAAVPYALAPHATPLQRLALMRLLSALLAGVTVLFAFLFLREALPGVPAAWTVGALGVALQPMFVDSSAGVNPDALLFAASAATFFCLARALRRGLEPALAVALGAVVAIGLLAKLTYIGFLPGIGAGVLVAALRQPGGRRRALGMAALTAAVAALPVLVEVALNVAAWHRPALGLVSSNASRLAGVPWERRLEYAWELYLPPLPGMRQLLFYGTTREWLGDMVGTFGVLDTSFPRWVSDVGSLVLTGVAALALAGLWRGRAAVRRRWPELLVYALMAAGLLLLVAAQSLSLDRRFGGNGVGAQLRYLLPLLPGYAALLALAARAAGRRGVALLGTTIVGLALAHTLFSELLAIGRYYG